MKKVQYRVCKAACGDYYVQRRVWLFFWSDVTEQEDYGLLGHFGDVLKTWECLDEAVRWAIEQAERETKTAASSVRLHVTGINGTATTRVVR